MNNPKAHQQDEWIKMMQLYIQNGVPFSHGKRVPGHVQKHRWVLEDIILSDNCGKRKTSIG